MSLVAQTAICDLLKQLAERLSKNNFHIILSAEKTVLLKFSKYVPLQSFPLTFICVTQLLKTLGKLLAKC